MSTPTVRALRIKNIRLDFQPAEDLLEHKVQMFVARLECGEKPPLLTVRFDGRNYFLQDGFHRVEAARRHGLKTMRAEIFPGTLADMEREFNGRLKRFLSRLRADRLKRERRTK